MSEFHPLTDQKYAETAEYLFQTIEMAKSDEEFDEELCSSPTSNTELELELLGNDPQSMFSWKLVKRRQPRRRYTVSHGGGGGGNQNGVQANGCSTIGIPPAPPSTPTSLTPTSLVQWTNDLRYLSSAPSDESIKHQRVESLVYIFDCGAKYRKILREQQRTDAELAELFNVVSITAASKGSSSTSKMKVQPERGVASTSRTIRKQNPNCIKLCKFHRNGEKKFFREPDDEDSVSAPEYDADEKDIRFHRLGRIKPRLMLTKRERRFARFEHQERMEAIVDTFDEAMSFNET